MRASRAVWLAAFLMLVGTNAEGNCIGNSDLTSFGAEPEQRSFIWTSAIFDPLYFPTYDPLDYQAPFSGALTASFWALGSGSIDNNGSFDLVASGSLAYGINGTYNVYYAAELDTDWNDPTTNGCNGPDTCTCLLLEDADPLGRETFFAVVSAKSDSLGATSFNLTGSDPLGNASPIVLRPVPPPTVTAPDPEQAAVVYPTTGTVEVTVTVRGRTASSYEAESGAGCDCGPMMYEIYEQVVTRTADWSPPADRSLSAWALSAPAAGGAQTGTAVDDFLTISVTCPNPLDERVYLAARLYFDSGFSTAQVSGNSIPIECVETDEEPLREPPSALSRPAGHHTAIGSKREEQ